MTATRWGCSPEAYKAYKLIVKIMCIGIVAAILILAAFCIKFSSLSVAPEINSLSSTEPLGATLYIPTVRQLQEALCEAGYTVEIDCEVGDETKAAWSAYIADREAKKYFTESGEPK